MTGQSAELQFLSVSGHPIYTRGEFRQSRRVGREVIIRDVSPRNWASSRMASAVFLVTTKTFSAKELKQQRDGPNPGSSVLKDKLPGGLMIYGSQ